MLYPERCKATPLVTPTTTECSPRKPPASHTQIAKSQIACGKNRHIDNQIFMDLYSVTELIGSTARQEGTRSGLVYCEEYWRNKFERSSTLRRRSNLRSACRRPSDPNWNRRAAFSSSRSMCCA